MDEATEKKPLTKQGDPKRQAGQRDEEGREPGKTPGSAESGGKDVPARSAPGKTPGNAEG
jgi:hypothetical protein